MHLGPSGHVDTFCRDNLPPRDQWPEFVFSAPGLVWPERLNAAGYLLGRAVSMSGRERVSLRFDGGSWSYGDLVLRANQVAEVLTGDVGLVSGNRVLLMSSNHPWHVASWLGILKAGCVAVDIVPTLREAELGPMLATSQVNAAIVDERVADDVSPIISGRAAMLTIGGGGSDDLVGRAAGKSGQFLDADTAADDVAIIAFTSGTTGAPKAAAHFHRDLLAIAETYSARVLKPRSDDVFTGTAPLSFTFGLGGLVIFPLHVGASTLLIEERSTDALARMLVEHAATVLFTVPTAYRALVADGHASVLRSLRRGVAGGEPLSEATWQAVYESAGLRLTDGIGSTEMLHNFIATSEDDIRPGATGKPVPGYVAALFDDEGLEVGHDEPGHLAIRGPTGCRYLTDDRQRDYVRRGWNFTGDIFTRDRDGYFWHQARADDMIISSGYNIAGPEVENVLLRHKDVTDCAVVGVPDSQRGAVVKAYVVLRDSQRGDDAVAQALQEFVKTQLAPHKYPRRIDFVNELPYGPTGKLQRFRLVE